MLKLKIPYLFLSIFFFSLVYSQEIYHKIIDKVEENKNITIDVLISEEYSKINNNIIKKMKKKIIIDSRRILANKNIDADYQAIGIGID